MSNEVTKTEFEELEAEKEKVKSYTNGEITVYWRAEKCIHSANCIVGNPTIFNAGRRPWIDVTGVQSEEIIKTVDTCPSRALIYMKNQGVPAPDKGKEFSSSGRTKVQILKNGPALISGDFILTDSGNQPIETPTEIAAICRCGASRKKPLCDGSHSRIGFTD